VPLDYAQRMHPLDPQAILAGRTPGRPSIKLMVGMVVTSLCALAALALFALLGGANFFVCVVPVPIMVAGVLLLDRLEPEPARDLVFAFLWGAGVAVLGALVLNTLGMKYITEPVFGDQGRFWTTVVGAPVVEEALKGAVLFVLLWFRRNEIDGVTDGLVYAAMVALGFAMMENVSYYLQAADSGTQRLEAVFILRGLVAPLCHPLFTAMTGLGVAYAANRRTGRVAALLTGLLMSMVLHSLWNTGTLMGAGGLAAIYLLDFFIIVGLLTLVFLERRGLVRRIGHYLPVYLQTGLVTPEGIEMLGQMPLRRKARRLARSRGGRDAARAMSEYQLAATELVLLHQRMDNGVIDVPFFALRRDQLLRLMSAARRRLVLSGVLPGGEGHFPGPSDFAPPPR
jgi:RsiW-degrading membrane proteinase PrsW (M82 family)